MQILDLTDLDLPHIEIAAYRASPHALTIAINRNGVCVFRARIPLDTATETPIEIKINIPEPETRHVKT